MSQKNETTVLVLALLITLGLVGGGVWWFTSQSGTKIGNVNTTQNGDSNSKSPDKYLNRFNYTKTVKLYQ